MSRRFSSGPRLLSASLALVTAGLAPTGCGEVEMEPVAGYEPARVQPVQGTDGVKRVMLTAEGARRAGLQTAPVREDRNRRKVVPYAALIYDPEGRTFVYTSHEPLTYVREEIEVERIEGDRALLSDGPPAGTEVVTVGAAQVHGAELEIAG